MYESFFQLKQRPFAAAPSVDCYFPGAAIEGSRQALVRSIERAEGAALLVGLPGTGKTLLCHVLAERFRGQCAVALLSNGHLDTRRELLQAILFELALPYQRLEEGELRLSLIDYVSNEQNARDGLLLIVDEAHTLSPRLLEEVRLIANIVRHGQPRVRLLLVGNPGLEELLADPQLAALNQRIATRCYLEPLDYHETQQFVLSQLGASHGVNRGIFTPDALEAVYRATDGVPRLINQVCDHALTLAFAGGSRQIDAAGVEEAWSDLQQLPAPWNASGRKAAKQDSGSEGFIEFGNLDDDATLPRGTFLTDEIDFAPAGPPGAAAEATLLIHQIDEHLSQLEREYSSSSIADMYVPSAPVRHDPFGETFDEEEVIVDRYAALEPKAFSGLAEVECTESHSLSALLDSYERPESRPDGTIAADTTASIVASPAIDRQWLQTASTDSFAAITASTDDIAAAEQSDDDDRDNELIAVDEGDETAAIPLLRDDDWPLELDEDLMVIEDDPTADVFLHSTVRPQQVRRQEYRQLFSSLRRG